MAQVETKRTITLTTAEIEEALGNYLVKQKILKTGSNFKLSITGEGTDAFIAEVVTTE